MFCMYPSAKNKMVGKTEKKNQAKSITVTMLIRNTWSPLIHIQSLLYHTSIMHLLLRIVMVSLERVLCSMKH